MQIWSADYVILTKPLALNFCRHNKFVDNQFLNTPISRWTDAISRAIALSVSVIALLRDVWPFKVYQSPVNLKFIMSFSKWIYKWHLLSTPIINETENFMKLARLRHCYSVGTWSFPCRLSKHTLIPKFGGLAFGLSHDAFYHQIA